MTTVLVCGGNGQVGWELARRGDEHGLTVVAPGRDGLDITDPGQLQHCLAEYRPRLLINAAAYTAVDRAEQEPEQAFAINRDGPRQLAEAAAEAHIPLFHISTDYVFDGQQKRPYQEDDPINPLGIYGQSKWAGEEAVRHTWERHLIIRTSWVFGRHGHNFVKTMLRLAGEREELRVVDDQHGCPTYAGDIATLLLTLAGRVLNDPAPVWGTFHFAGDPPTTWYRFAAAAIDAAKRQRPLAVQKLTPITTADYPTPARRPTNSVLDCGRLQQCYGLTAPAWQPGLQAVVDDSAGENGAV